MNSFIVRFFHKGNLENYWQGDAYNELRALATALDKLHISEWSHAPQMKVEIERINNNVRADPAQRSVIEH